MSETSDIDAQFNENKKIIEELTYKLAKLEYLRQSLNRNNRAYYYRKKAAAITKEDSTNNMTDSFYLDIPGDYQNQ